MDLALLSDQSQRGAPPANPVQSGFLTYAELREQEKTNVIAAQDHTHWRIWGPDGAAVALGIKPSTLTYRMKILGIETRERT